MIRKILLAILFLLLLAVLELNKNSLWGWALFVLLSAAYCVLRFSAFRDASGWAHCGLFFGYLALFAVILFASWPPTRAVPAVEAKDPARTGILSLKDGQVRGVVNEAGTVEVFAGIPYAQPPVGDLRWKEPQDVIPWTGVLEADHFAPMSMQPTHLPIYNSLAQIIGYHDYEIRFDDQWIPPVSEDALYVNVWRPAGGGEKLPVLVYVHGGSLQTGQPWYQDYRGESLAQEGVIVVNMGYRLGVFGYLALEELAEESPNGTSGNYGLLDQIQALRWVRDNIAFFGGDPDNVTLAGESAGAASVSAICASPLAKGLFERAVLESSAVVSPEPPHSFRLWDEAVRSGRKLMARYKASSAAELRALPAKKLVKEADNEHHITVDAYALPKLPYEVYLAGDQSEKAILHGFNKEESAPFILFSHANLKNYEKRVRDYFKEYADEVLTLFPASTNEEADRAWADIFSVIFFDYSHYCLSRLAAAGNIPVYEYYFTKDNGRLSSWHSGEEVYLYGNIPEGSGLYDARDRALSAQMKQYLLNFMRTGSPNGTGLPLWEETDGRRVLELGEQTAMREDRYLKLYEILDRMQGFSLK